MFCAQGQSAMNDVLRELHRKMDEIIGRQERSLSVLTAIQVNCCEETPYATIVDDTDGQ